MTGIVISKDVVGVRVRLDGSCLPLYEKPEEMERDKLYLQKKYLAEQMLILEDQEPSIKDLPPKGRSAHLTVATAKGIPPKETNEALLDVCDIEYVRELKGSGAGAGQRIAYGTVEQMGDKYFVVKFDQIMRIQTLFGGF